MSNSNNDYSLKKFDIRKNIPFLPTEKRGPVIVLLGKRGTGKSHLLKDIMSRFTDIPFGTAIGGTELSSPFFANFLPSMFIQYEYDNNIIRNFFKRQLQVIETQKEYINSGKGNQFDPRAFLILDDCLFDDRWTRDKLMRMVFLNGRHWNVMLILSMQYPMGLPPLLRENIDFCFILKAPSYSLKKKIYENYASVFPNFDIFCSVLDQTTTDRECMVIDNCSTSGRFSDTVFWYRASSNIPDFKIGAKKYWDLSNEFKQPTSLINMLDDDTNKKKKKEVVVNKFK